jgi:Uma2 family endonuclease
MATVRQGLTLEEFLALPEEKPALEYFAGTVTQKVAPKGRHSRLQYKLAEWFNRYGEPRRLVLAFPELRTTYGGSSLVPDVAIYRWERIPWTPDDEVEDEFFLPPDIAIEVTSPDQSIPALTRKCRWYVAHEVPLALLVVPPARYVVVFRQNQPPTTLRGAERIDFSPILPGLTLSVDELFAFLKGQPGW